MFQLKSADPPVNTAIFHLSNVDPPGFEHIPSSPSTDDDLRKTRVTYTRELDSTITALGGRASSEKYGQQRTRQLRCGSVARYFAIELWMRATHFLMWRVRSSPPGVRMMRVLLLCRLVLVAAFRLCSGSLHAYGSVVRIAPSVRDSLIAAHCDGGGCRLVLVVGMVGYLRDELSAC